MQSFLKMRLCCACKNQVCPVPRPSAFSSSCSLRLLLLLLERIVTVLCTPQVKFLYLCDISDAPVSCLLCTSRERSGDSESKTASSEAKQRRTACALEESHQPTATAHTHGEGERKTARYPFFFGASHSSCG